MGDDGNSFPGIILLVLGLPISQLVRYSPEPYGYLPDGDEPEEEADSGERGDIGSRRRFDAAVGGGLSAWQRGAANVGVLDNIDMSRAGAGSSISATGVHQVAYIEADLGFSEAEGGAGGRSAFER